jgi:hypothetical protein
MTDSPCVYVTERATEGPCAECGAPSDSGPHWVTPARELPVDHDWLGRVLSVCGQPPSATVHLDTIALPDLEEVAPKAHAYVPGQECTRCWGGREPFASDAEGCIVCGGLGVLTAGGERVT